MLEKDPTNEKLIDLSAQTGKPEHANLPSHAHPYPQPDEPPLHDVTGSGSFSDTGVHVRPSGTGFDDDYQLPIHPDNLRYNRNDWMRHPITSFLAGLIAMAMSVRIGLWTLPTISVMISRGDYPSALFATAFPLIPLWLYWRFLRSAAAPWVDDDSYMTQAQVHMPVWPFL